MGEGSPAAAAAATVRKHLAAMRTKAHGAVALELERLQTRADVGDPKMLFGLVEIAEATPGALPLDVVTLRRRLADALILSGPEHWCRMSPDWPGLPAWQAPPRTAGIPTLQTHNTWSTPDR